MPGGSSARAITPLLPNDLAANHCLFRLIRRFHAILGAGWAAGSLTLLVATPRYALSVRAIAPLLQATTVAAGSFPCFCCGHVPERRRRFGRSPPISMDGNLGFARASDQTTRVRSPLIWMWNMELIPGRSLPSLRAVAPRNIRAMTP
jgi:hypothetical protein